MIIYETSCAEDLGDAVSFVRGKSPSSAGVTIMTTTIHPHSTTVRNASTSAFKNALPQVGERVDLAWAAYFV
jgi:hypothetical protein